MVKKADVILFVCLVLFSVGLFALIFFFPKTYGNTLTVTVDGAEYCRVSLNEDTEIILPENTVVVKDGKAYMKDAHCPDKICINQGQINKKGETVVCLPAGVILEVE